MALRIIFMGTPAFAVPTLTAIAGAGHSVAAVYTRAPKPARRGMAVQETPVAQAAHRLGLPVLTPASLKDEAAVAALRAHGADVGVVVAYGLILPQSVLDALPRGFYNLHASLLPRWRGAAPINRAVMAGDAETGVMVMRMEAGLDTGPVALAAHLPIAPEATAGDIHDRLAPLGADLMLRALEAIEHGTLTLRPQPADGVLYAEKISKSEARIDWARPAQQVHNHCRGLSPAPGAWCEMPTPTGPVRLKVLRTACADGHGAPGTVLDDNLTVACGAGAVRLVEVQQAGARAMGAAEFLRGAALPPGTRLA